MTLEQAKKMAQKDANEYGVEINIIHDRLSEEPEPYTFCAVGGMNIMYPQSRKDFWSVVEVVKPI